ncbi:uncharacterized protein LOC122243915 [Penaeus japonicus]|uniref:uncharacterized protein LOC122243915 n=1 Tax=Penaeus japonicus TaxID=27405 RepID=UPI001C70B751|nr:uncharacterized protein LOC122243915 [Penaeus japonicus]
MLWLICLCLLVVSEVGAVRVDEDCLVQDRLFMRRHKPKSAAFFAYVQHNGSIFTATILCDAPKEFYFLHVTSQDIAWEERLKHSIKRRKSPNSKEGWMSFTYHTDTHQLSDNEGRFWNDKEVLKDCSFLNISVRDGLLAQRMCDDGPKWLVTEDRCADVHLPLTSGKTLSINLSSNDSFIPLFESKRFTAKLVRVEGELALVEDESCPGCQPLQGERNVLRLPLSASNQKIAKPFPRAVRVCSSTGKSFTVSVSQTQEGELGVSSPVRAGLSILFWYTIFALDIFNFEFHVSEKIDF